MTLHKLKKIMTLHSIQLHIFLFRFYLFLRVQYIAGNESEKPIKTKIARHPTVEPCPFSEAVTKGKIPLIGMTLSRYLQTNPIRQ